MQKGCDRKNHGYRGALVRAGKMACDRCRPHSGENRTNRERPDGYKNHRRGR